MTERNMHNSRYGTTSDDTTKRNGMGDTNNGSMSDYNTSNSYADSSTDWNQGTNQDDQKGGKNNDNNQKRGR